MTVSVRDKVQDAFKNGGLGTSSFCVQVSVEYGLGKVDTSNVRRKLNAKCTTLFCVVSMHDVTSREMGTDCGATLGQRMGSSAG